MNENVKKEKNILFPEIGEIKYTLIANSLEKYKE